MMFPSTIIADLAWQRLLDQYLAEWDRKKSWDLWIFPLEKNYGL